MRLFSYSPDSDLFRFRLNHALVLRGTLLLIGYLGWQVYNSRGRAVQPAAAVEKVLDHYRQDLALLDTSVQRLRVAVINNEPEPVVQERFRQARYAWKRVEWLAEYYHPTTAKSINGPALVEVEEDDPLATEIQPEGFQVVEEYLFPSVSTDDTVALNHEIAVLHSNVKRLRKVAVDHTSEAHLFDALRLELFRIQSLGITGFDSPVATGSIPEAAQAIASVRTNVELLIQGRSQVPTAWVAFDSLVIHAKQSLDQAPDFNHFDRLAFIRTCANPLSEALYRVQQELHIDPFQERRLLRTTARSLSDPNAFDAAYFVASPADEPTPERTLLGQALFFDPVLSGNNQRSCASCHQPDKGFSDGVPKSISLKNGETVLRNAPTLWNVAYQAAQFYDSRVTYLEDQVVDVIANPNEMHGSLKEAARKLSVNKEYLRQFKAAYPEEGVTEHSLKNALASYLRSLQSLDSPVDKYLRGEQAELSLEEKAGFNVFMGKGKCATCHFYPLYNGTVPPGYELAESEVLGVPASANGTRLDRDPGKYGLHPVRKNKHAFKTPTVRNVALTAPYMHNGVYQTLEEVVEFYNKGGGAGLGFSLDNQTLPGDSLHLSTSEKKALIAFMKVLTSTPASPVAQVGTSAVARRN
ncbi:cytochrome c peroxidase [Telluribacter sp. SYSU D00476]|uniref:cytochrome c peroxidase n=1 Tax=Telluribacter sp. SYSU D00476 TaxID=2811430 RepID=UPI001FF49026|nr:cytochrome c peroxidase [Telluribacter sp. SYSU D00476]